MKSFWGMGLGLVLTLVLIYQASAESKVADFVGEKITYTIKQMGIKAGEATLTYAGPTLKEGKTYTLIVFHADGLNFLDDEKIYADPQTLMPQIVERDLNIFGNKEKITEYYDSQKGTVKVSKFAGGKTTEVILKKQGVLDNIYCFIYRCRRDEEFEKKQSLLISLPTVDLKIMFGDRVKLSVAGKKYSAIFMHSDPSKYKIWFDIGEQKIPLRIDGAVGIANTSMVMKNYEQPR